MEKSDRIFAAVTGGFLLPVFQFAYGDGHLVLYAVLVLAIFIAFDWISGRAAARRDGVYSSEYGKEGVYRTGVMLAFPAGGHFIDMILTGGIPVFFGLFAGGLFYHTLQSFAANIIRAGWDRWMPAWMLTALANWVKDELDHKLARALKRKAERATEQ